MAYFAELDDQNIVLRVIVVPNKEELDGEQYCHDLLGGRWVQTSYNAATNGYRGCYAGIGYTFDEANNVFVAPYVEPTPGPDPETGLYS